MALTAAASILHLKWGPEAWAHDQDSAVKIIPHGMRTIHAYVSLSLEFSSQLTCMLSFWVSVSWNSFGVINSNMSNESAAGLWPEMSVDRLSALEDGSTGTVTVQ